MTRNNWIVDKFSIRPFGKQDECFYCHSKIGTEHKKDCVIRERIIKLRMTTDIVIDVPEFWDEEQINFHFNESSCCVSNILDKLEERDENHRCLCDCTSFEYIGEATEEDENEWGIVKVKELES